MKRIKRVLCTVFVLLLVLSTGFSASAVSYDYDKELESDTVLVVNLDTGMPVFEKNADKVRYPASLTKIMTYIIAYENIDDVYNTRVEIKQSVLNPLLGTGSSMSGLDHKVGKSVTVIDLLHCLMITSGNDAALVLADYVGGGNTNKFVDMMNAKAKALGCKNTNFVNPHGLHDSNHRTTARDLYTITSYAMELPLFSEITNKSTYYCEDDTYPLVTTNYMIDYNRGGDYYYSAAKGVKTGTTDEAGRCLITTGILSGNAYMCICMGAPYQGSDHNGAMTDAKGILKWALESLEYTRVLETQTPCCEVKVNFSNEHDSILLYPKEIINTVLPIERNEEDIVTVYDAPESIDAPIKKGDVVGKASIYYKDVLIKTIDLVAGEDIEKSEFTYTMHVFKSVLLSWVFWVAAGLTVALLIVYIALVSHIRSKNKRRRVKKYRSM